MAKTTAKAKPKPKAKTKAGVPKEQPSNLGYGWYDSDKLVKADWNYKTDDAAKKQKLLNNIKRNGQIENLLIRELDTGYYEVVNGNHRLEIMHEIKMAQAFCFNLGKISVQQAQRIAIETNETRFETDTIKLATLIGEIMQEFGIEDIEDTMPYTTEEIENFNKMLNFDWDSIAEGSDGSTRTFDSKGHLMVCPECGHKFEVIK
jgi:hypothetical protein